MDHREALAKLQDGNARFVAGLRSVDAIASAKRLAELADRGQRPFAAALACADSRVPVESLFDTGIGEMFVTRVAGNIVSPHMVASLEYAAVETGATLIFILGHTGCGAIKAALAASQKKTKKPLTNSLQVLVDDLRPAVDEAVRIDHLTPYELIHDVERENVRMGCAALLEQSPALASLVVAGKLRIMGAICDTRTGRVQFGLEDPSVSRERAA